MYTVTDIVGEEILPGSLVAYSMSGRNSKSLNIYLVYKVTENKKGYSREGGRVYFLTKGHEYEIVNGKYQVTDTFAEGNKKYSVLSKDRIQDHIVVIKNPFFSLDNPDIAKQMEICDMAIDAGLLPKDYKFGVPIEVISEVENQE